MKKSKNFFKLEQNLDGKVFWSDVFVEPLGESRISIQNQQYHTTPDIQACFLKTKLTNIFLDDVEKETVFNILKNVGFYDSIPHTGMKAARTKDALYNLPKAIGKIQNPPLPSIEKVSDFDLEGQGAKITIPSNIIDIYTRLAKLLGLNLSGHTDTLTEASNLTDELFTKGEIQNEQQYRNALDKFSTK